MTCSLLRPILLRTTSGKDQAITVPLLAEEARMPIHMSNGAPFGAPCWGTS
jgi:hypothetical protein